MIKRPFTRSWKLLLALGFGLAFFLLSPDLASAQIPTPTPSPDPNSRMCIGQYGVSGCTANDFGVQELILWHIYQSCTMANPVDPTSNYALVDFEVVFATSSPTRYDIALFMSLNGTSAITGVNTCHHEFLDGPITTTPNYMAYYPSGDLIVNDIVEYYPQPGDPGGYPPFIGWWNGEPKDAADVCGDMNSNTSAVVRYTAPVWMKCQDNNGNGIVDIHVCGSYDNNAVTTCTGLSRAYPGTTAKCGCNTFDLDFSPTAVEGLTFNASSSAFPTGVILSALGLILLGGGLFSAYLRRRTRSQQPL
jgi:hypothetical protein